MNRQIVQKDTRLGFEPRTFWCKAPVLPTTPLCSLLAIFFTLYTSDFQHMSESCHLQKYSDDSAFVVCIRDGQEAEYRDLEGHFVAWCGNNHLILHANKTKEIIVDFRKNRIRSNPISIMGVEVKAVQEYKYLGVRLDKRLKWRQQ